MDFRINTRLTSADYIGLDMNQVRELKRAQETDRVRPKDSTQGGEIMKGQTSLEQEVAALERASKKLETAGRTVHQVEDLLSDTLTGFRANRAEMRPDSANASLLRSADETAQDIVGYARFDEDQMFPPSTSPVRFEEKKAVNAYGDHKRAFKQIHDSDEPREVTHVVSQAHIRLRGEGGVLPTLGELAENGMDDPAKTDHSLGGLKEGMARTRAEIETVKRTLTKPSDGGSPGSKLDVAS